ncbi:MAG TPA: YkvA family protein [Candidatus Saccharimonadia bacterium]|nr:YkvA family protein [Candidatus Saccharimonadia bacterium]
MTESLDAGTADDQGTVATEGAELGAGERTEGGQPAYEVEAMATASPTAAAMTDVADEGGSDPFPRDAWATLTGHAAGYLRLTVALLRDPAVSKHRRAALLAAAAYFASPIDLIPGIVPVLGQVDDLAVAMLAIRLALNALEPGRRQMHLEAAGLTDEALHDDLIAAGRLAAWAARAGVRTGIRAGRGAIRFTVRGGRAATALAMRSGRAAGRHAAPVADRLNASRHDASTRIRRRLDRGPTASDDLEGFAIAGEVDVDGEAREPSVPDGVGHRDGGIGDRA